VPSGWMRWKRIAQKTRAVCGQRLGLHCGARMVLPQLAAIKIHYKYTGNLVTSCNNDIHPAHWVHPSK